METKIGCTGWSYDGWSGKFYPSSLAHRNFLKYYSQIFSITEINSTFYRMPNASMTKKWFSETPDNFVFTAKFPKTITHEFHLNNVKPLVSDFLASVLPLKQKLSALLLQFPPSLTFQNTKNNLTELLSYLPNYYTYPIEGRHESWFTDEAIDFLTEKNLCLVWNELPGISNPCPITSDFLYVRLIGDRTINENQFGAVVKDNLKILQKWATKIIKVKDNIPLKFVFINNHLEGFAPASANSLRRILGMPDLIWYNKNQTSLQDFDGKILHDLYRHSSKLIK